MTTKRSGSTGARRRVASRSTRLGLRRGNAARGTGRRVRPSCSAASPCDPARAVGAVARGEQRSRRRALARSRVVRAVPRRCASRAGAPVASPPAASLDGQRLLVVRDRDVVREDPHAQLVSVRVPARTWSRSAPAAAHGHASSSCADQHLRVRSRNGPMLARSARDAASTARLARSPRCGALASRSRREALALAARRRCAIRAALSGARSLRPGRCSRALARRSASALRASRSRARRPPLSPGFRADRPWRSSAAVFTFSSISRAVDGDQHRLLVEDGGHVGRVAAPVDGRRSGPPSGGSVTNGVRALISVRREAEVLPREVVPRRRSSRLVAARSRRGRSAARRPPPAARRTSRAGRPGSWRAPPRVSSRFVSPRTVVERQVEADEVRSGSPAP